MLLKKQSLLEWGVQGVGRGHASLEPRLSYYNMFVAKRYMSFPGEYVAKFIICVSPV